jgi:squalene cyclase
MQNDQGGFATYELVRGPKWLEWLNPAEVFGMVQFHMRVFKLIIRSRRGYHD